MGKLIVTEFVTLDGIIDDPGGAEGHPHGGWSIRFPTPDGEQFKFEELLAADVQLMGRVTYDGFAAAWPAMEEITGEFGKRMNNMAKVVVSTTLTDLGEAVLRVSELGAGSEAVFFRISDQPVLEPFQAQAAGLDRPAGAGRYRLYGGQANRRRGCRY